VVLALPWFAATSAGGTDTVTVPNTLGGSDVGNDPSRLIQASERSFYRTTSLSTGIVFKLTSDEQCTTLLAPRYNPNVENGWCMNASGASSQQPTAKCQESAPS